MANGLLFFSANYGALGNEFFVTDGTAANTLRLTDHVAGEVTGLIELGGRLLFFMFSGGSGLDLWETDGTPAGTVAIVDGTFYV